MKKKVVGKPNKYKIIDEYENNVRYEKFVQIVENTYKNKRNLAHGNKNEEIYAGSDIAYISNNPLEVVYDKNGYELTTVEFS